MRGRSRASMIGGAAARVALLVACVAICLRYTAIPPSPPRPAATGAATSGLPPPPHRHLGLGAALEAADMERSRCAARALLLTCWRWTPLRTPRAGCSPLPPVRMCVHAT